MIVAPPRNNAATGLTLARGMPRVLNHQNTETLGTLLGCDPGELRHAALPPAKPWKRPRRR